MSDHSRDELRRDLRAAADAQAAARRPWRTALDRAFGDPSLPREVRAEMALGGLGRRRVLQVGGFSVAMAAVLAACGRSGETAPQIPAAGTAASTTTTVAIGPVTDLLSARTANSLENSAVAVYDAAIPLLPADYNPLATLFRDQHAEHGEYWTRVTRDLGGEPYTATNPNVQKSIVDPALAEITKLSGEDQVNAIIAFAQQLETVAAATYQATMEIIKGRDLRQGLMAVGAVEARHAAALAKLLPNGEPVKLSEAIAQAEEGTGATTTSATTTTTLPSQAEGPVYQVPGPFGSVAEALGPASYV